MLVNGLSAEDGFCHPWLLDAVGWEASEGHGAFWWEAIHDGCE